MLTRRSIMKLSFISAGLAGLGIISLSGCYPQRQYLGSIDVSNAAVGLVRTHDSVRHTRVYYLTRKLEMVGSVLMNKAGVADTWTQASTNGNEVFLPVDGLFPAHDGNEIVCLNVLTQELETWSVELPQQAAGCNSHAFAFDNYSGVLHVTSFERDSGTKRVFEIEGGINTTILWHGSSLWVSRVNFKDGEYGFGNTDIYQLTPDLDLIGQAEITSDDIGFEFSMNNVSTYGDTAYFTASKIDGGDIKHICRFDLSTYEYEWIPLEDNYPYNICFTDDEMVVLHSNVRGRTGKTSVCVYTPDGTLLRRQALSGIQHPNQLAVSEDAIFVSSMDYVYAYDLKTLEPIASLEIDPEGECYRNVALFAMPGA